VERADAEMHDPHQARPRVDGWPVAGGHRAQPGQVKAILLAACVS
jgi:hypothetical protein